MKKLFCLLTILTLLFVLCACSDGVLDPISPYEKTRTNISKDHVNEFINAMGGEKELGGLATGYTLDKAHCYNVTPIAVAAETDMMIFKFSHTCMTFVLIDNQVYPLGLSFGGYGFVNAVPCDFDNDGNKDLLYAYSWGSGVHRSVISVFNSATKESTNLYNTMDTSNPEVDLIVATSSSLSAAKNEHHAPYYEIYLAEITRNDKKNFNAADLSYEATGLVGSIEVHNGTPVFKPAQN